MKNSTYPSLLNKRARIFASLNRIDLIVLGTSYLVMAKIGISSLIIMLISIGILGISKVIQNNIEPRFFENILSKRIINWSNSLGEMRKTYE